MLLRRSEAGTDLLNWKGARLLFSLDGSLRPAVGL